MKLAPSKNPEKESVLFGTIGIIGGIISILIYPAVFLGLGASARGIILSKRVNNTKFLVISIFGLALSLAGIALKHNLLAAYY